jgi:ATP-dependent Lon protease
MDKKHLGSDFDEFLESEGLLEDAEAVAAKRVIAFQIAQEMKRGHVSKSELARRMKTSRPAVERLQRLHDLLEIEVEKVNIDKRINVTVKKQMEKAQKEYYLNEKIKAIHRELGRKDDRGDELAELRERIEKASLPKEAREKADADESRV